MSDIYNVNILETRENYVSENKEKVLNWGVFACNDGIDDIHIEKSMFEENINFNYNTEGTCNFYRYVRLISMIQG